MKGLVRRSHVVCTDSDGDSKKRRRYKYTEEAVKKRSLADLKLERRERNYDLCKVESEGATIVNYTLKGKKGR